MLFFSDNLQGNTEVTLNILKESLGLTCTRDDAIIAQYVAGLFSYRGVLLVSSRNYLIIYFLLG